MSDKSKYDKFELYDERRGPSKPGTIPNDHPFKAFDKVMACMECGGTYDAPWHVPEEQTEERE